MSEFVAKWGEEVHRRGFAQIPNLIFLLNDFADDDEQLKPIELLVLLQLTAMWWKSGKPPFPSMETLARRCGTSERTIERAMKRLTDLGLLERVKRRVNGVVASNRYDLEPLAARLQKIAAVVSQRRTQGLLGHDSAGDVLE
jgi:predicted transcriptional regulator